MKVIDQIAAIKSVLIGRGVDRDTIQAMIRAHRAAHSTHEMVLKDLVGCLYDGLAYGNWPAASKKGDEMIEWVIGPLHYPASSDWRYWCPQTPSGLYRAWHFMTGLPLHGGESLLGDEVPLEEAKRLCEEHLSRTQRGAT